MKFRVVGIVLYVRREHMQTVDRRGGLTGDRCRPGEPNDRQTTFTHWRGNGSYGVIERHGLAKQQNRNDE